MTWDVVRVTLDMPVELNDAVNAAARRTSLSKAQYMRMSLEVLGLLAGMNGRVYLDSPSGRSEILMPGVLRAR